MAISAAPKDGSGETRIYPCDRRENAAPIADVKSWLEAQEFDCQQMLIESDTVVLQIKKSGGRRDFVGTSTALNIVFRQSDHTLAVEIAAGKWIDKAAVGNVSMFILWPLAVTAAKGAWDQWRMREKVFSHIAEHPSCHG